MSTTQSASHKSNVLFPALALATIAGVAFTIFLSRRSKSESTTPVESVIDLCSSAAEKLEAMIAQAG